ncbi:heavy metal-associated isoprenylated plant protein 41-like [Juglans microcarpa x Juglans regia]|uniref:heavy metal-associated isoprenylated plant protein 41-like n=1 Tax=Juglans microcarpa x Juglans regia TaxID=2249226 RepID=UPI001B7E7F38|nr:heavy metal-associated isoprenylated plant protein 41-like [Juglans microcarpa x Juglans regia]
MAADQEAEREVGVDEEEERWVMHYSSNHQILLVGEGDFSFSLSLARSFGSASNILASSLDSYDVVIKKYKAAKSNLENLEKLGASLLHGVDATRMKYHTDLKMRKFNRIVFNFPHVGFYGKEDNEELIKMHRELVNGFFSNAKGMLRANGEIHVNHKTTAPFCKWNIPKLASKNSLVLVGCVDFKKEDFPGYNNKRGDGSRCDNAFPLGKCSTFKFMIRFNHTKKKSQGRVTQLYSSVHGRCQQFQGVVPNQMQQCSTSINFSYPLASCHLTKLEETSEHVRLPLTIGPRNQLSGMFDGHLHNPTEIFGRTNYAACHLTKLEQTSEHVRSPLTIGPRYQLSGMFDRHLHNPTETFGRTNYAACHLTKLEQTSEHVRLPLTIGPRNQLSGMFDGHLHNPTEIFGRTNYAASHLTKLEQTSEHVRLPLTIGPRNQLSGMFDGHLHNPTEIFGRTNYDLSESFHAPRLLGVRDFAEIPRRNLSGHLNFFGENPLSTLHPRKLVLDYGYELKARRDALDRQYLRMLVCAEEPAYW